MRPFAPRTASFAVLPYFILLASYAIGAPSITSLSPTSGAVGAVVTIAGTNFGATQGTSTVKFNGTTATPTSWSATSIAVPVPSGATTGNVVVTVSGTASNGKSFTVVTAPSITSLSPTSAAIGTSITLTGTNFGTTQGSSTVKFNGTAATPTSWSATSIAVPVPAGATTGNVVVHASGVDSNGKSFTVLPTPSITTLSPTSGAVGASITLTGTNFGTTQGASTVKFNGTTATPSSWSATSIAVPVPAGATTGNVVVHASGVDSNGKSFTVLPTPSITSLSPTSGSVGTSVTITGTNFGATQGTSTVKFNGTTATPTSWSGTSVVAPVPAGATTGNVVVTVSSVPSNGAIFTVVSGPSITTLSPSSAAVGTSITITGTNFGATQGSSTVTFNGIAATPTSWSATSIAAPVPSGATTGNVVVTAGGVASAGKAFTVAPAITGLSPSSGAVGTVVTINGTSFGSPQGSSTVKFNGTLATPTSWSATSIVVPVPTGATTGTVVVTVGGVVSTGVTFTVLATPSITSLSPTSGVQGISVTITGTNFGSTQGGSTVKFNGTTGTPTIWSATSIKVPVPAGATTGNVVVHASGVDSNGSTFTVLPTPSITGLAPTSGMVGDSVTITGTNFGATQGTSTVKFNGTSTIPTSWSDTSIVATVPTGATTGNVVVTVSNIASAGVSFTVIATPSITSVSPTSGAIGTLVTINGTNFQPTQGSSTVTFNGTLATPTTWNATQIKAPVPNGAANANGGVVVTVFGFSSNGQGFTVKPTPLISALSQTIGSVGMLITISGANFGTTQGSSTVKFNGVAATPSSWSAIQIAVPVPSGATTGSVVVHTSGVDTNGINFTVATVTSLAVTPQGLTVPVNSVQRFIATATYSNGSVQALAGNNAVWSSSSTPVATIDASGLVTTLSQGQTTVQAAVGALNSSGVLSVKGPSFIPVGSLNAARWRHTATLLADGRVLIVGGGSDHNTLASAELYDPVTKTFSWTGALNTPRQSHTATLLQNGKVLISAGVHYINDIGPYAPNYDELYDPATGVFTPVGTAADVISGPATILPSGKVLFSEYLGKLYDPTSGNFAATTGSSLEPLGMHTAALLSAGTVLVVGGGTDTPSAQDSVSAQIYDPQTDTFSLTGSFNTSTTNHSLTRLNNSKVLLAGGINNAAGALARTELYDPASGTFSLSANLAVTRAFPKAVLLNDGTALIIGGDLGGTAELFDPSSQTFVGAGAMTTFRSDETATLLNDGTVLIVGGSNGTLLASSELYAPPLPPPASLQITPATTGLLLGQTKQFKAVDELGHLRFDATWTVSDPSIAPITAGNLPTLTAVAAGQVTLTATVQGVTAQLQITLAPSSLQVTPAAVNLQVGETRQFNVVDNLSHPSGDVMWAVSDTSLASVTSDNQTTLTALNPGQLTLTATVEGVSAQAQVTIQAVGVLTPGTILWSNPAAPGFAPLQIAQAVPTDNGPGLYSIQVSNDSTQSVVEAITADGLQMWQTSLPVVNGNSVPDGSGGLLVTEHNTCLPNQTDPMTIVDLDAITGQPKWQFAAAGVQNGNQVVYCYPDTVTALEPQFAIRGDGAVAVAAMTNNGLPPLMIVQNGQATSVSIPGSTGTRPDGTIFADFSPEGPPIVDSDGSTYMEYEVRYVTYPPKVLQAVLYVLKIAPDGSRSDITLNSTTEDENLLPGRIIPDGQGGVLATWTVSPSSGSPPLHPYQASHVVGGAPGTPYDLPFSPHTAPLGKYPTMVLGENGTAFASGLSAANDGSSSDVDQIASFDLNSGTSNWNYQASTQGALSIVEATSDGGLTINDTDPGIIHFDTSGNASATIPFLQGAKPFDLGGWVSGSNGGVNFLWSPTGTNGIPTTLAQSVFPAPKGNVQGQNQPPFCRRTNSNCVLAPHLDLTGPNPLSPGVNLRQVVYELYSLQSGALTPMVGSSQTQQTRIAGLETNPTNPAGVICDWKTVNTKCESPNDSDTAGIYTDKYSVGSTGVNTVKQQFFVDRGQVRIFWPQGNPKTWYGAWDQQATTDANNGAIIQQNSPDLQNGATCTLSPPDPHGCSPVQVDGTQ